MTEQNEQNDLDYHIPRDVVETFVDDSNSLRRDKEILTFTQILQSSSVKRVISVDGGWGCGKSFFVQHTKLFCENYTRKSTRDARVLDRCKSIQNKNKELKVKEQDGNVYIYYDAWKNDAFGGDPILSIIYNLFPDGVQKSVWARLIDEVTEKDSKIGTLKILVQSVYKFVLHEKYVIQEFAEPAQYEALERIIEEIIEKALSEYTSKNRFIIFIDELDRCNPRFAVKVLERVKHFFDNPNLVFVFSVNLDQLQHTIKEVYGQNFDAMNYLHRFFDYQITLSTPDMEQFVGDKLNFIVEEADAIRDSARYAIESYELSIRDTIRYIDALKIVYYSICAELKKRLAEQKEDVADTEQPAYRFVLEVIAPLLLGQKIADADRYNTIVSQRKVQEYDKKPLFKERIKNYLTTRNIKYAEYLDPSIVREEQKDLLKENVAEKAYDRIFPLNQKQASPWGEKYVLSRATRKSLLSVMGGLAPQKKSDSQDIWEYTEKRAPLAGEIMTIRIENVDFHFVYCPEGRFTMGSPDGKSEYPLGSGIDPEAELGRSNDETPHEVTLTKGFWIGQYPVTQAQYKAITGENPANFKGNTRPVERVTWHDSVAFCEKLNQLKIAPSGYRFALPTEAQWEYACRAGTTTALNNGKPITSEDGECPSLDEVGWYWENSGGQTHPVMEKQPNTWGIYDMHGNVYEWCADWYGAYPRGEVTDPTGAETGKSRVLRGGSWISGARSCRSAYRGYYVPGDRDFGFRLALVPEQETAFP